MADAIVSINVEEHIPAGVLGPTPVTVGVSAFLVPDGSNFVLVDTGMEQTGKAIESALAEAGADWSDVSDIVITHAHPDHIGALGHARASAPEAVVHANPLEKIDDAEPLTDGEVVGSLRVFVTPGHTPGHLSLFDEGRGALLVGDCLGVMDGKLIRAPAQFTSDAAQAERSLHRLLELRGARMLFAHGPEIDHPWQALDDLLVRG